MNASFHYTYHYRPLEPTRNLYKPRLLTDHLRRNPVEGCESNTPRGWRWMQALISKQMMTRHSRGSISCSCTVLSSHMHFLTFYIMHGLWCCWSLSVNLSTVRAHAGFVHTLAPKSQLLQRRGWKIAHTRVCKSSNVHTAENPKAFCHIKYSFIYPHQVINAPAQEVAIECRDRLH